MNNTKNKDKKMQAFNNITIPLRQGISGRVIGFIFYNREQDIQAHMNHRKVKVSMILRGRFERRCDFMERAKKQIG